MSQDSGDPAPKYKPGDIANGHILTAAGWLPLRYRPIGSPGPYYPGDVIGGNVFTGAEWVPFAQPPATSQTSPGPSATGRPSEARPSPGPRTASGRGWLVPVIIGATVLIGVTLFLVAGNASDGGSTAASDPTPTPTPTPSSSPTAKAEKPKKTRTPKPTPDPSAEYAAKMQREGWVQVTDGLWARWESPDGEGNIVGVTWKMRVLSPEGCPNGVYVEANVVDTSGTVVGFTNAMLPSLGANSQALLSLSTTTGEQQVSLDPTKATCY